MSCAAATCSLPGRASGNATDRRRETILLLHGSGGNGNGWRRTATALGSRYRCLTPDLIGYGTSLPWPNGVPFTLDAERLALEPLLACCADTFHLVGYSYGGVVALDLALAHPARVRTLTLIEPVLFNVLREAGKEVAFQQFARMRADFVAALAQGDAEQAMRPFFDFWSGYGAWRKLLPEQRADLLKVAGKIALDWEASFAFAPAREHLEALGPRTVLLRGDQSLSAMLDLVDALHACMRGSSRRVIAGANHLLPITRAAEVTQAILTHANAGAPESER